MSLAGGYPGRSAPSVKRCAAERTLNVTRLARLDLSGTTGTKLVNYVVSDRVIRSDPSASHGFESYVLHNYDQTDVWCVYSPPELQNLYVEKVAYIPFAIQVRVPSFVHPVPSRSPPDLLQRCTAGVEARNGL